MPREVTIFSTSLLLLLVSHPSAFAYYDPGIQRWINRDPLGEGGGLNLYGYVQNRPMDYIDPLGLKIIIEGPNDFRNRVRRCVKELRKTKCGRNLWDEASKSKDVLITIKPAPDAAGPYAGFPPRCSIGLDSKNPIFVGSESELMTKYPEELPPYKPNDKNSIARACACILGHELGHAFLDLDDEPPDGRNVQDCENRIRCQLGVPGRTNYHGMPLER